MTRFFAALTPVLLLAACGKSSSPPDVTAPQITFFPSLLNIQSGSVATAALSVTDAGTIAAGPTVSCSNGGTFDIAANRFTAPNVEFQTESVCTVTATDAAGNVGSGTLTANITPLADETPPTVSFSPATLSVESEMSATATLTASDVRGVASGPDVSCTNGGMFDVAANTFTAAAVSEDTESICTATAGDAAGNEGTGTLTVTMTPPPDIIAPTVSFDPLTLTVESGMSATAILTASDDTAVTTGPSVTCTNGGVFEVSTNSFTAATVAENTESVCTATAGDAAGNEGTAILTVTMLPPAVITPLKVRGTVQSLSPFTVAQVEFDVSGANVTIDEESGLLSDLSQGQIVSIEAEQSSNQTFATAFSISTEETANVIRYRGAAGSFSNLNFKTTYDTIDTNSFFVTGTPSEPRAKVDGIRRDNGSIVATYIRRGGSDSADFELHGIVEDIDTISRTLRIDEKIVSYATITPEDFPENRAPENGDLVEASGPEFDADGTLIATRLEFEGDDDVLGNAAEGDLGAGYGFVTDLTSTSSFKVNEVDILTSADTSFEGLEGGTIAPDTLLSIHGSFDAEGNLVATTIFQEYISDTLIVDTIDAIDQESPRLAILGLTFEINNSTIIMDRDARPFQSITLNDLKPGYSISITGNSPNGDKNYIAKEIWLQNLNFDPGYLFAAPLTAVSGTQLSHGPRNVTANEDEFYYLDYDLDVGQEAFLNAAQNRIGDTLRVSFGYGSFEIGLEKNYLSD